MSFFYGSFSKCLEWCVLWSVDLLIDGGFKADGPGVLGLSKSWSQLLWRWQGPGHFDDGLFLANSVDLMLGDAVGVF